MIYFCRMKDMSIEQVSYFTRLMVAAYVHIWIPIRMTYLRTKLFIVRIFNEIWEGVSFTILFMTMSMFILPIMFMRCVVYIASAILRNIETIARAIGLKTGLIHVNENGDYIYLIEPNGLDFSDDGDITDLFIIDPTEDNSMEETAEETVAETEVHQEETAEETVAETESNDQTMTS